MGWVARCIRGGISPPHPDRPTMYNVRRSCGVRDPDGGSGAALGTKSLDLVLPYPSLSRSRAGFFLSSLALLLPRGSQGELLKLYCRALKRRKRRKNNMTLLPSARAKGEKLYMRLESRVVVVSFAVFRRAAWHPSGELATVFERCVTGTMWRKRGQARGQ